MRFKLFDTTFELGDLVVIGSTTPRLVRASSKSADYRDNAPDDNANNRYPGEPRYHFHVQYLPSQGRFSTSVLPLSIRVASSAWWVK